MAAVLLVAALIFGGGSRGFGDLVVHLAALPALALGILRWRCAETTMLQRAFFHVLLGAVAIVALQLLPLSFTMSGHLPERAAVLGDLVAAGASSAPLPVTLDRWGTARALLALTSFASMWLIASLLAPETYLKLLKIAVLVAIPLVLLGFAQVSGVGGNITFHRFQNTEVATAVFSNRNHFATLLAMLVPFPLLFGHQAQRQSNIALTTLWYFVLTLLLLGAATTFSRMGALLASFSAAVAGIVVMRSSVNDACARQSPPAHSGLIASLVIAGISVANYAWGQLINRFQKDPLGDRRWDYLQNGWAAAKAYMPWGAGFGSFRDTYGPFEPVGDMTSNFALHAHNDVLELLIEAGIPGIVVLLAALILIGVGVWRCMGKGGGVTVLGKVLAVSAVVPLIHSVVDYPLRTLAVGNIFALVVAGILKPNVLRAFPQDCS